VCPDSLAALLFSDSGEVPVIPGTPPIPHTGDAHASIYRRPNHNSRATRADVL
jgi:hypothetical protein